MATKLNFCPFKNLPDKGVPGHLYFVKDSPTGPELYLAARDGTLCPVTELFNLHIAEAPGRDGRDGVDGAPGAPGHDGVKGNKGDPGDVCYIGPAEVEAAVQTVRAELVAQRASFKARILNKLETMPDHPVYRLVRVHLENLLRETDGN